MKPFKFLILSVILAGMLGVSFTTALASEIKTVAVLPFQIHASEDLSHIRNGMTNMFHSRLSWRDHVNLVPKRDIKTLMAELADVRGNQLIRDMGEKTGSSYILTGSVTKLAGAFSIDAKVFDLENKRYMAFFEQSKKSDDLIEKVDRIAANINKKVFDRSTLTWDKMEQERQAHINELKRKNPEYMMQNSRWQNQEEEVGWKIWKYLF